ncbi:MAG: ThuA domain-containing protein [Candidatus Omnitrophica bacterium]|nr:ThuA domain-containing protein [Candidatus Omnitrophota bacterium]
MRSIRLVLVIMFCCAAASWSDSVLIVADEWPQMEILGDFLHENGGLEVEKAEQNQMPESLSSYRAVFMFIHGAMEREAGLRMIEYAESGGRLIVMHHGISSKKRLVPEWLDMLGVHLPTKEEEPEEFYTWIHNVDYYLVNLQPKHYITSHKIDWPTQTEYRSSDFPSRSVSQPAWNIINSEVFINHNFKDGREKTVLCGFKYKDPESGEWIMQDRGAWYKPAGRGWVFYFQPGHTPVEFQERNYCRMIMNCLTWQP